VLKPEKQQRKEKGRNPAKDYRLPIMDPLSLFDSPAAAVSYGGRCSFQIFAVSGAGGVL